MVPFGFVLCRVAHLLQASFLVYNVVSPLPVWLSYIQNTKDQQFDLSAIAVLLC